MKSSNLKVYWRPTEAPAEPALDERPRHDDAAIESPLAVRVEVPAATGFDDLTDTEWSAFMGLR